MEPGCTRHAFKLPPALTENRTCSQALIDRFKALHCCQNTNIPKSSAEMELENYWTERQGPGDRPPRCPRWRWQLPGSHSSLLSVVHKPLQDLPPPPPAPSSRRALCLTM